MIRQGWRIAFPRGLEKSYRAARETGGKAQGKLRTAGYAELAGCGNEIAGTWNRYKSYTLMEIVGQV